MIAPRISFFVLLLLLICSFVQAQEETASLTEWKQQLIRTKGQERVDLLIKISRHFLEEGEYADSVLYYSEDALNLSGKLNYAKGESDAWLLQGLLNALQGDFKKSIVIWKKALKIAQESELTENEIKLQGYLGYSYQMLDDYEKATLHYLKATKLLEETKDYDELANNYHNIASVFATQEQFKQSHKYITQSLALLPKLKREEIKLNLLAGTASIFAERGLSEKNYLDSSIHYAQLGLILADKMDDKSRLAQLYSILSADFLEQKNDDQFLSNLYKAFELREYMSEDIVFQSHVHLVDYHLTRREFTQAAQFTDSLLESDLALADTYYEMIAIERGYLLNKATGEKSKAFDYLEKLRVLEDSLLRAEKHKVINELEQKYNKAINEKTIQKLDQERNLLSRENEIARLQVKIFTYGFVLVMVLVILVIFIYRQRSNRLKAKMLETELRLSRSRINPHFFFNALTVVQTKLMAGGPAEDQALLLAKYAKIMRLTLEASYHDLVTVETEMNFVKQYLDLLQVSLGSRFHYEIQNDSIEETEFLCMPSMLLQPIIENSVEHGFGNNQSDCFISIRINSDSKELKIQIEDNGFAVTKNNEKGFPSRANSILKDRLFLLERKVGKPASFHANKTMQGFCVDLHLPIITEA